MWQGREYDYLCGGEGDMNLIHNKHSECAHVTRLCVYGCLCVGRGLASCQLWTAQPVKLKDATLTLEMLYEGCHDCTRTNVQKEIGATHTWLHLEQL